MENSAALRATRWSILSRHRNVPHLERKLYHLGMGLLCFWLYAAVLDRTESLVVLGTIGGFFVVCDMVRFWFPKLNALTLRIFGKVMRREELRSITGNSFYILGLGFVVFFFAKPVALLSVLYLAIGDPVAAVVGTQYGTHKIGKKSLEGCIANWVICSIVTYGFLLSLQHPSPALFALVGGLISMVAEIVPSPVDDNFTIPVVSACLLSALVF